MLPYYQDSKSTHAQGANNTQHLAHIVRACGTEGVTRAAQNPHFVQFWARASQACSFASPPVGGANPNYTKCILDFAQLVLTIYKPPAILRARLRYAAAPRAAATLTAVAYAAA